MRVAVVSVALTSALIAAAPAPLPARADAAAQAGVELRDVRLTSGIRLHYASRGPASGPAMLMLHGYTDTWFSFSRVLPLLPASMRVIVPDQRGHGASDRPGTGYDMDDFARDAIELMDVLEIERATIVGHSMGSFVARRIALLAPTRVSGLVLIGAGPTINTPSLQEFMAAIDTLGDPVDPAFVREFQLGTVNRPVPPEFMERAIADSQRVPMRVWKSAKAGMLAYKGGEREINSRTLLVGGDKDGVFPAGEQRELARLIPGADIQIFEGTGHAPHWEDPERVVRLLDNFLTRMK